MALRAGWRTAIAVTAGCGVLLAVVLATQRTFRRGRGGDAPTVCTLDTIRVEAGRRTRAEIMEILSVRPRIGKPDEAYPGDRRFPPPKLSARALDLLEKNGFAVVPRFHRQIFSVYLDTPRPHFITTDSIHAVFHVNFLDAVKRLEAKQAKRLAAFAEALAEASVQRCLSGKMGRAPRSKSDELLVTYAHVPVRLLWPDCPVPRHVSAKVEKEVQLIQAAVRVAVSPVMTPQREDYTQYTPRGIYNATSAMRDYFRAYQWFGRQLFRVIDATDTLAALKLAAIVTQDRKCRRAFADFNTPLDALLGPPDDLTPVEYARIHRDVRRRLGSSANPERMVAEARKRLRALRSPGVNSAVVGPRGAQDFERVKKGLRVLGQRYTPDAAVFQLVTHPRFPGRGMPSAVDVFAAAGIRRAKEIVAPEGAALRSRLEKLAQSGPISPPTLEASSSNYAAQLRASMLLFDVPTGPRVPPFMTTPAWQDKCLNTAFASYTALRHAWALHVKQTATWLSASLPGPPGFVEPAAPYYRALASLAQSTEERFAAAGVVCPNMTTIGEICTMLADMSEKQLAGEALTDRQKRLIVRYGKICGRLCFYEGNSYKSPRDDLPIVVDVFTELSQGSCLELAIGRAAEIHVRMPSGEGTIPCIGGVYTTYEFEQPTSKRLTDEAWRAQMRGGPMPLRPAWQGSFVVGMSVVEAVERIGKGEVPEEVKCLRDERVTGALLALARKAASEHKSGRSGSWRMRWSFEEAMKALFAVDAVAARRLILDLLPSAEAELERKLSELIAMAPHPAYVPALTQRLASASDEDRVFSASHALSSITDCRAAEAAIGLLKNPNPKVREAAVRALGWRSTFQALNRILNISSLQTHDEGEGSGWPDEAETEELLLPCLSDENDAVRAAAVRWFGEQLNGSTRRRVVEMASDPSRDVLDTLIRVLRRDEAGVIARLLDHQDEGLRASAADRLSELGGPVAAEALVKYMAGLGREAPDCCGADEGPLFELRDVSVIQWHMELLANTHATRRSTSFGYKMRICDRAAEQLARLFCDPFDRPRLLGGDLPNSDTMQDASAQLVQ